jgi:hypothetical protein
VLNQDILQNAQRLIAAGANYETILFYFRENGFDKIDSIQAIRALYKKPFPEAKQLVHESETWSDRFDQDNELRETAMRALRDIAASNAGDPNALKITIVEPDESKE